MQFSYGLSIRLHRITGLQQKKNKIKHMEGMPVRILKELSNDFIEAFLTVAVLLVIAVKVKCPAVNIH